MYAVCRNYSGSGAKELFDLIVEQKDEVERIIRGVSGFVQYTLVLTDEGGFTVTVCENKEGTDESVRIAKEWIADKASNLNVSPPSISEGEVKLRL